MSKLSFLENLVKKRGDTDELVSCIKDILVEIRKGSTDFRKPGILLGKIQSGKTRAFIGVMAHAFDEGYDFALVLTKGTNALAQQTKKRIEEEFIKEDLVQIHDIMHFPKDLSQYELNQKMIVIAKKEVNNLKRALTALHETYPDLKQKKMLIIDDEADFASIVFKKVEDKIEQGKISTQIDQMREAVKDSDYLQVTATPYSLYLQPESEDKERILPLKPKRPAFTVLLPIYKDYVGGDYFFGQSQDEGSSAYCVFKEVPSDECEILKESDRRSFKLEECLNSPRIATLRLAIMNFIVGANIRRLQEDRAPSAKYSLIIHTERTKASHEWQRMIVDCLVGEFEKLSRNNLPKLDPIIQESYKDLARCASTGSLVFPSYELTRDEVLTALRDGYVSVSNVNSDADINALLDEEGQLKLRTPLNIFIGGQILDRGITIRNLIGFYYGRRPKSFQQDTVLQHSRIYGRRPHEDLVVTRLYTTLAIYETMQKIHEFDEALRDSIKRGAQESGVYFIRKDSNGKLKPCSPNKLLLSKITTLRPYKRLLPQGFNTIARTKLDKLISKIDRMVEAIEGVQRSGNGSYLVDVAIASELVELINQTLEFEEGYEWDIKATKASIEFLAKEVSSEEGKVWLLIRRDRQVQRLKRDGRFENDPDGGSSRNTARSTARELALVSPVLILLKQQGNESDGWRGGPFWWPILVAPKNTKTSVFASEIKDID